MITVILLVITVLLWGGTPVLEKLGLSSVAGGIKPLLAVAVRSFAVSLVLLLVLIFTGDIKEIAQLDKKSIAVFSLSGIMAGFF